MNRAAAIPRMATAIQSVPLILHLAGGKPLVRLSLRHTALPSKLSVTRNALRCRGSRHIKV